MNYVARVCRHRRDVGNDVVARQPNALRALPGALLAEDHEPRPGDHLLQEALVVAQLTTAAVAAGGGHDGCRPRRKRARREVGCAGRPELR